MEYLHMHRLKQRFISVSAVANKETARELEQGLLPRNCSSVVVSRATFIA